MKTGTRAAAIKTIDIVRDWKKNFVSTFSFPNNKKKNVWISLIKYQAYNFKAMRDCIKQEKTNNSWGLDVTVALDQRLIKREVIRDNSVTVHFRSEMEE